LEKKKKARQNAVLYDQGEQPVQKRDVQKGAREMHENKRVLRISQIRHAGAKRADRKDRM